MNREFEELKIQYIESPVMGYNTVTTKQIPTIPEIDPMAEADAQHAQNLFQLTEKFSQLDNLFLEVNEKLSPGDSPLSFEMSPTAN